ncbi:unnamed protein product, partial [marine sediment metagenome]
MDTNQTKLGSGFRWLNATQFLGALNDNVFKLLIILFLIKLQGEEQASNITALSGAVFVVPFLVFTAFAGKLADRFSKRNIVVAVKVAEVVIMAAGCAAFAAGNQVALYGVLFLMAAQSAFFAPSKYGIVPELVAREHLSRANGVLEAMTYLAVIIGVACGSGLSQVTGGRFAIAGVVCVAVAMVGLVVSLSIPKTPAAGGGGKASILFVKDIQRTLWSIHRKRDLLLAVLAAAYFLLIGAFIYVNLIPYGIEQLKLNEDQSGYLFLLAAIGIGVGAFWAGRLSGRHVELGVVPLGAIGLAFSSAGLGLISGNLYLAFGLIFLMGLSAGLFIVPVHAYIQLR